MFPNQSSSYEISSKYNAFVQINGDEGGGSLNEMAHPSISTNPTQVPDTRDVKMVVKGETDSDNPNLTVITNHPSQAPANIPPAQNSDMGSDSSSIMPGVERQNTGALNCSIKDVSCNVDNNTVSSNSIRIKESQCHSHPRQSSTLSNIPHTNDDDADDHRSFKICDYNDYCDRWGIPRGVKLLGGGESSVTTGTSGWGTPPTSQSGNSGWNGGGTTASQQTNQATVGSAVSSQNAGNPSGGGDRQGQSQQWGGNNNNSNSSSGGGARQGQNSQGQQQTGGASSQNQAPVTSAQGENTGDVSSAGSTSTNTTTSSNASSQSGNSSNSQPGSQNQNNQPAQSQNGNTNQGGSANGGTGSSWAAAAGKGLPPTSQSQTSTTSQPNSGNSTKQQMEQLNTMREALFSQDGWGGQNVNQDSHWDIPGSPEPGGKDTANSSAVPIWKLPINNGTDIWETNLRNGGIPPPQNQTQKTPWGHTPSSNIGGTWGEEDEGDASNVWTGVPPNSTSGPQWPNPPTPLWPGGGGGGAKKEGEWGGPNWTDQRDPRDMRHAADIRQMMDPRDHMRASMDPHRVMGANEGLMRGDPRGISGRLNGGVPPTDAMWTPGGPGPHHHLPHNQGKLPNQPTQPGGGGQPIKELSSLGGKPTGWEEPSPPAQRRNMPNYDDGTSLWGSQHNRPPMPGQNKVSHWKDMPAPGIGRGSGGIQCPPGRGNPNMKPSDQPLWAAHPPRNGTWAETGGMDVGGPWAEDKHSAPWIDQNLTPSWQGGPKHKPGWDSELDPSSSWVHPSKQPSKQLSKENIWLSKQFRILTDMGFKKDEVENALRMTNMVLEDALELLNTSRGISDCWPQQQRRHNDLEADHQIINAFPSPQQICISYPQPSSRTQQTQQPSPQQLRMLVQQIQMAVQGGYLSAQILNQPLAPQTLLLLNQLLQNIKQLQQYTQHHALMQIPSHLGKPNSNQLLQLSVNITKTKQQINNLQNQISAQQALYVKHQVQAAPTPDYFNKNPLHDPLQSIHSNFPDLSVKEPPVSGTTSQQSRLNQWKLPAVDKDSELGSGNDFSRAPGSTAKPTPGSSSPNINPLLGQPDGTWSSVNRDTAWPDSGPDENNSKDWPSSSQPPSQAFSDLVPEFEPGKPWKGNPLKSIEDDPSLTPGSVVRSPLSMPSIKDTHILSNSSSVPGKASPTTSTSLDIMPPPLGLSSSTWSFNPPASSTSGLSKLGGSKNTSGSSNGSGTGSAGWGDSNSSGVPTTSGGDLWSSGPKRGPPPGLPAKPTSQSQTQSQSQQNNNAPTTNGWGSSSIGTRWSGNQSGTWGSSWLLLRNLTPQIDGSTLKTLCVQHGPLQNFHLYLNHGIALAKYASRDEANKAQGALNNCVLGNTTIFAESPGENEVHSLLLHLGQQGGSGSGAWRPPKEPWATGSNSQLWGNASTNSTASLWGDTSDQHRTTPSSLNSFLPGDLLGGESL